MTESYLGIKNLSVRFDLRVGAFARKRSFFAVKDITLDIQKNAVFCLIGESGSGKSTLMWALLGMHRFFSGEIQYKGGQCRKYKDKHHRLLISEAQMIFQDPVASLNPSLTLARSIEEPMIVKGVTKKAARATAEKLAKKTGLPLEVLNRKPGEVSIGQNQRACIARALSVKPEILFLDEPLTALDPIVQTRVKKLLTDMKTSFGLTYFLVTHDLSFAKKIGTFIAVMYLGRIVEQAPAEDFFENPHHPYSQALLSSSRSPLVWQKERILLTGEIPSPHAPPEGCIFHPRCRHKMSVCEKISPPCRLYGEDHRVYCHLENADAFMKTGTDRR